MNLADFGPNPVILAKWLIRIPTGALFKRTKWAHSVVIPGLFKDKMDSFSGDPMGLFTHKMGFSGNSNRGSLGTKWLIQWGFQSGLFN